LGIDRIITLGDTDGKKVGRGWDGSED
jgi:hypothetical protein